MDGRVASVMVAGRTRLRHKVTSVLSAELPFPDLSGLAADGLPAGPRGRDLCVNLLDDRLAAPGRRRVERAWLDALDAAAACDADVILVRDTTDRDGFTLSVPAETWAKFTATIKLSRHVGGGRRLTCQLRHRPAGAPVGHAIHTNRGCRWRR
jgi:Domain of unknown function (DUF397)